MLTEDGKHLYVSYDEYHNLIEKLAIKLHQSGWEFDTILCLARGGLRRLEVRRRLVGMMDQLGDRLTGMLGSGGTRHAWRDDQTDHFFSSFSAPMLS